MELLLVHPLLFEVEKERDGTLHECICVLEVSASNLLADTIQCFGPEGDGHRFSCCRPVHTLILPPSPDVVTGQRQSMRQVLGARLIRSLARTFQWQEDQSHQRR